MELTEDLPFRAMRATWQPVALAAALPPGKVAAYTLLDQELVLARFPDGRLLAADVACPHKGARLSAGRISEGELMCPYHGWRFDAEGRCQTIPSLVEPNADKLRLSHLRSYPVHERYGLVWVKLDRDGAHELPEIPEFENPAWTYRLGPATPFRSGFRREIENFVDMSHFAFAHANTLGAAADSRIPPMQIAPLPDGFEMVAPFPALETQHEPPGKLQSAHQRRQRCWLPNFTIVRQSFPDGDERILIHLPSPNTRERCTVFWALAISPGFRGPTPEEQIAFAVRVIDEDRQMCESQIPPEVPINPARGGWGILVTPGDTLANQYQKSFRHWLQKQFASAAA